MKILTAVFFLFLSGCMSARMCNKTIQTDLDIDDLHGANEIIKKDIEKLNKLGIGAKYRLDRNRYIVIHRTCL